MNWWKWVLLVVSIPIVGMILFIGTAMLAMIKHG